LYFSQWRRGETKVKTQEEGPFETQNAPCQFPVLFYYSLFLKDFRLCSLLQIIQYNKNISRNVSFPRYISCALLCYVTFSSLGEGLLRCILSQLLLGFCHRAIFYAVISKGHVL
jgi:hypothetical protein